MKKIIRLKNRNYELVVEDNGIGLSGDFRIESQQTLGMTIIQSLAEQISAKINLMEIPEVVQNDDNF